MTPGDYRTRSGHKARVLCNDAPGPFPCVGYWTNDRGEVTPEIWTISGNWASYMDGTEWDIIGPWEEET